MIRKRKAWRTAVGFLLCVLLPTVLAAAYYWLLAADRYEVEIRYSVRGGGILDQAQGGGRMGTGQALIHASDSFILQDYIESMQSFVDIERRVPLRAMLARDGGDWVRGYDQNAPVAHLMPFWTAAVSTRFDAVTGITTATVALFDPADAEAVGWALIDELQRIVDSLSEKARLETLRYVNETLAEAEAQLASARTALENFRQFNRIISPTEQVVIGADIIGALSARLAERLVELRSVRQRTPDSPRIETLENEITALQQQLGEEFARRGGTAGSGALPSQITDFDKIESDYEIARDAYIGALRLKQEAEAYASLGRAELVVFVEPLTPTVSTRPDRLISTLTVFGVALGLWVILRVVAASVTE